MLTGCLCTGLSQPRAQRAGVFAKYGVGVFRENGVVQRYKARENLALPALGRVRRASLLQDLCLCGGVGPWQPSKTARFAETVF